MRFAINVDTQFDGKLSGVQRFTGVQNYIDSLLSALYSLDTEHDITAFAPSLASQELLRQATGNAPFEWQRHPRAHIDVAAAEDVSQPGTAAAAAPPMKRPSLGLRRQARAVAKWVLGVGVESAGAAFLSLDNGERMRLASRRYDVLHVPNPLPFVEAFDAPRFVVTVYDLTTKLHPWAHETANIAAWAQFYEFMRRRGARVIAISEATKCDIVEHLGIPEEHIDVTPLAPRLAVHPIEDAEERRHLLPDPDLADTPFVLYAGTLEPRKNLERLVKAFARVVKEERFRDHKLVLAGNNWNRHDLEMRLLALEQGIGGRVVTTGYVSNESMNALMSGCAAFAYISMYEGFGLPPLEAMVCGAPVLTSNASSLPEVVGDAGIQVNPLDIDAIADGLRRLLGDEAENRRYRALSRERAKEFSWERTARLTLQSYERAAAM